MEVFLKADRHEKVYVLICVKYNTGRAFEQYTGHLHRNEHEMVLINVFDLPNVTGYSPMNGITSLLDDYERAKEKSRQRSESITKKYEELCQGKKISCSVLDIETTRTVGYVLKREANELKVKSIVLGACCGWCRRIIC